MPHTCILNVTSFTPAVNPPPYPAMVVLNGPGSPQIWKLTVAPGDPLTGSCGRYPVPKNRSATIRMLQADYQRFCDYLSEATPPFSIGITCDGQVRTITYGERSSKTLSAPTEFAATSAQFAAIAAMMAEMASQLAVMSESLEGVEAMQAEMKEDLTNEDHGLRAVHKALEKLAGRPG
jgi:hypothetical protein